MMPSPQMARSGRKTASAIEHHVTAGQAAFRGGVVRRTGRAILAGAILGLAAGCPRQADRSDTPAAAPFEGQTVRLVVVDDPELAGAIRKQAGEWKARSGAELELAEAPAADTADLDASRADAVIFPAWQLAELAMRDAIVPLPNDLLRGEGLAWQEVLPTLRDQESTWGEAACAVPFGSPGLVCYYRADLFARVGKTPPATWAEYQALAEFFQDRANLGDAAPAASLPWSGALEPAGEGWAGLTLLARAAAYARHPYYQSTLFDQTSMAPLIDRPPFVRALSELVAARKLAAAATAPEDPEAVRAAFWRGECAMALAWPRGAWAPQGNPPHEPPFEAAFGELPGALEVYDPVEQAWQPRPQGQVGRVPLLGLAGRLGTVLRGSPSETAAFQLLVELAGDEWGPVVAPASRATTCFRTGHAQSSRPWVERIASPQAARSYGEVVLQAAARPDVLFALRIPGRPRYLAALDAAVAAACTGERTPEEALQEAAAAWRKVTEELGIDRQREAYQQGLGQSL
jgi:multiple sugar transport system substrate-binding protein